MRLATVEHDGEHHAAVLHGEQVELLPHPSLRELLATSPDLGQVSNGGPRVALEDVRILPPVPEPEKIVCVGLNFADHAAEAKMELPDYPTLFAKYSRSLIGPDDEISMPRVSDAVDWEAELGLVIGRPCRDATEDEALAAIAGYTVVNDISMRDWQLRTPEFLQGKTFEDSTPVGPYLVTPDEVDHARDLTLTCAVNGEEMQHSTTAKMVFSPAQIVAYISQIITLVPGDLIACGTPSGIGGLFDPPRYLKPGDVVTTSVEGVGELINRCSEFRPKEIA